MESASGAEEVRYQRWSQTEGATDEGKIRERCSLLARVRAHESEEGALKVRRAAGESEEASAREERSYR
jgi:hypothetical protein